MWKRNDVGIKYENCVESCQQLAKTGILVSQICYLVYTVTEKLLNTFIIYQSLNTASKDTNPTSTYRKF